MSKTINYIEYKATKPDGTVDYSEVTKILLPPECYAYTKIEQINHYMSGTTETFILHKQTAFQVERYFRTTDGSGQAYNSPVPPYNPETDGDYTSWLMTNNID